MEILKNGMVRNGDLLAIQWRERTSNVPTRYHIAWSVFRIQEFSDNSAGSIDAACKVALPGKGLTSVWLSTGKQFHYALVEMMAENISKRAALKFLADPT